MAKTANYTLRVKVDDSPVKKGAKSISSHLRGIGDSLRGVTDSANAMAANTARASTTTAKSMGSAAKAAAKLGKSSNSAAGQTRGLGSAAKAAAGQSKRLASGAKKASSETKKMGPAAQSAIKGLKKLASAAAAAMAVYLTFASAAAGVRATITAAADYETAELRLQTFTGSAEAAAAQIAELSVFAEKTPFELPGIIEAQTKLLTLGDAAFASKENLTLIGDAAAAVGQPMEDVAEVFKRAYAETKAGKPLGEAGARMRELGILAPEAAQKIEELNASGASSSEIWAVVTGEFGRFEGNMDRLSQTLTGRVSTMKDAWGGLLREVGQAGPFQAAKVAVDLIIETLEKFRESGTNTANVGGAITETFFTAADAAMRLFYGFRAVSNVVEALGGGLVASLEYMRSGFFAFFGAVADGTADFTEHFREGMREVFYLASEAAEFLGLDGVAEKIRTSAENIDAFVAAQRDYADDLIETAELIQNNASQALEWAKEDLAEAGDMIAKVTEENTFLAEAEKRVNELRIADQARIKKAKEEGAKATVQAAAAVAELSKAEKDLKKQLEEGLAAIQAQNDHVGAGSHELEVLSQYYKQGKIDASQMSAEILELARSLDKQKRLLEDDKERDDWLDDIGKQIDNYEALSEKIELTERELELYEIRQQFAKDGVEKLTDEQREQLTVLEATAAAYYDQAEAAAASKKAQEAATESAKRLTETLKDVAYDFASDLFQNGAEALDNLADYALESLGQALFEIAAVSVFGGDQAQLSGLAGVFQNYLNRGATQAGTNAAANAATTAASGAAGTAGYSAATGGAGASSAALGTVATYAAIAAVAAYVIDGISGGKLFGTSYAETQRDYTLDFAGGELSAILELTRERERSLFRGTSTESITEALDVTGYQGRLDTVFRAVVESAEALGIDGAEALLDGFSTRIDLELAGRSQEEIGRFFEQAIRELESQLVQQVFPHIRFAIDQGETTLEALREIAAASTLLTPDLERRGVDLEHLFSDALIESVGERLRYILAIQEAGVTQGVGQIPYIEHHVPNQGFDPETGEQSGPDIPYFPDDVYDPETGEIDPVAWDEWRESLGNYADIVEEIAEDMVLDEAELLEAVRVAYLNQFQEAFGGIEQMTAAMTAYTQTFVATSEAVDAALQAQINESQNTLDGMFSALGTSRESFLADFQAAVEAGNLSPEELAAWYQAAEVLANLMGLERDLAAARGEVVDINSLTVDQLEALRDRTNAFNQRLEAMGYKIRLTSQQALEAEAAFGSLAGFDQALTSFLEAFAPDELAAMEEGRRQQILAQYGLTTDSLAEGGRDLIVQMVNDLLAAGNYEELEQLLAELGPVADYYLDALEEEERIKQELADATDAINARLVVMGLNLQLTTEQVSSLAERLGGLGEVTEQINLLYSEFFSSEEQLVLQREAAYRALVEMGLDVEEILAGGRAGWRQRVIDAINSGAEDADILVDAIDEVDTLFDAMEAMADAAAAAQAEIDELVSSLDGVQSGIRDNIRYISNLDLDGVDPFAEIDFQIGNVREQLGGDDVSTAEQIRLAEELNQLITERYEMERGQILDTANAMVAAENERLRAIYAAQMVEYNAALAHYRAMSRLASSVETQITNITQRYSALNPLDQLGSLQSQFRDAVRDTLSGESDGSDVTGLANQYLSLAQDIYGFGPQFLEIRDLVLSALGQVGEYADSFEEPERPELVLLEGIQDSAEATAYASAAIAAAQESSIAELERLNQELEDLRDQLQDERDAAEQAEQDWRDAIAASSDKTAHETADLGDTADSQLAELRESNALLYNLNTQAAQTVTELRQLDFAVDFSGLVDMFDPLVIAVTAAGQGVEGAVHGAADRIVAALLTERTRDNEGAQGDRTTTTGRGSTGRDPRPTGGRTIGSLLEEAAV